MESQCVETAAQGVAASSPPWERWGRMCGQFEDLIEAWLEQSAVPEFETGDEGGDLLKRQKEWGQQLASVSMAAQRVAGLRSLLMEMTEADDQEVENGQAIDSTESRHWRALQGEAASADEE